MLSRGVLPLCVLGGLLCGSVVVLFESLGKDAGVSARRQVRDVCAGLRAHALTAVAAVAVAAVAVAVAAVAAVAATLRLWLATPPASLGARRTCMVG